MLILGESEEEIVNDGVKELKEALNLSQAPMHIEGFDIANIQGTDPTYQAPSSAPSDHTFPWQLLRFLSGQGTG